MPTSAMLGQDGQGFDIDDGVVLPVFTILSAACSNGFMAAAIRRTIEHVGRTRHVDTGASLADLPTIRNYIARMQLKKDMSDALLADTLRPSRSSAPTRPCESWNAKLLPGRLRMTCSISRNARLRWSSFPRKWQSSDSSVTLVRPASWGRRRTSFTTPSARLSVEFRLF